MRAIPFVPVLIAAALGCQAPSEMTDDGSPVPDAPTADADFDAEPDGPEVGIVTVTVNDPVGLQVLPGVPVVFIQPDHTTIRLTTDAQGNVSATVSAGTSVTAFFSPRQMVATILDARPGDHLVFGNGHIVNLSPATLDVTFAAYPGGADSYRIYSPCSSTSAIASPPGTTTITLDLCNGPVNNTDAILVASELGAPVAGIALRDVDLTAGALVFPEPWMALADLAVAYTNVPPSVSVGASYVDAPELFGASGYFNGPDFNMIARVPANSRGRLMSTDVSLNASGAVANQHVLEHLSDDASTYDLDLATVMQPWISRVEYDEGMRSVAVVASGQHYDLVEYTVQFGEVQSPIIWSVYSPNLQGLVLPALPTDLDPTMLGAPYIGGSVRTFEVPLLVGWDAVRSHIYELVDPFLGDPLPFGRLHSQLCADDGD